jgi:transcriptional regulator with XRE-family HTH domain
MDVHSNIRQLRKQYGLLQKQVAEAIGVHPSNYNKIEKGERQLTIEMLVNLSKLFNCSVEEILYLKDDTIPTEVTIEDKKLAEQIRLVQQLDDKDKAALYRVINTMLTKQRLKLFLKSEDDF